MYQNLALMSWHSDYDVKFSDEEIQLVIALVSLSLGVTNLIPFPPLDGGKIILLLIFSYHLIMSILKFLVVLHLRLL